MWTLVMPVKVLARAKSRLAGAAGPHRERLALAVAADTVSAAVAAPNVASVIVVTSDPAAAAGLAPLGARIVPDEPDRGLNPALAHGAGQALDPAAGVAALIADLPALNPAELARALDAAAAAPTAFVADTPGMGTTLYTARPGARFSPGFGSGSRSRHLSSGAHELLLDDIPTVRRDVDTIDDLREVLALGAGPRTRALSRLLIGYERATFNGLEVVGEDNLRACRRR